MRGFIRHSVKIGEHSRFVLYQKPSEYFLGQIIWWLFITLPLKLVHYISSIIVKLIFNGMATLVFWIKNRGDEYANEDELEDVYESVDSIADVIGYICEFAFVAFVIFAIISAVSKHQAANKEKAATPEGKIEILKDSIDHSASIDKDVEEFISNNNELFSEDVKKEDAKKASSASLSLKKYCSNVDKYDGKFIYIKKAKVLRKSKANKMYEIEIVHDESDFFEHTLNVYFYHDIDCDYGDTVAFYAYTISQDMYFTDESVHFENGKYNEFLVGSFLKLKEKRKEE